MTWQIIQGDCRDILAGFTEVKATPHHLIERVEIPDRSVHTVITSPPYWALRDYGVRGQLGLEADPAEYIDKMVQIFSAIKRILRDDGVLWLNLGDCYTGAGYSNHYNTGGAVGDHASPGRNGQLLSGNLVGIPWLVALALQADGWILRRDVIWSKPNPMPESVNGWRWERCRIKTAAGYQEGKTKQGQVDNPKYQGFNERYFGKEPSAKWTGCPGCPKCAPNNGLVLRKGSGRCTTAHEYVFQFAKTADYFYDCEAVREGAEYGRRNWSCQQYKSGDIKVSHGKDGDSITGANPEAGRNRRSVWEIATQPYPEAHFATYPEALIEPMVKAATSARGCCPRCGAPWVRILDDSAEAKERLGTGWHDHTQDMERGRFGCPPPLQGPAKVTKGWLPSCSCEAGDPVPCTVFDPFGGSGTTGAVAVKHGRNVIICELNGEYIQMAEERIAEAAEAAGQIKPDTENKQKNKPTQLGLL